MPPLITQIHQATQTGALKEPFTTHDLKEWIVVHRIVKDDAQPYAEASIDALLSNSDEANNPTSNMNQKMLKSRIGASGKKEYWF